jgi:UDP-GlcNAc:undecaprenyl-phosphate GlcNAc-1-phosphate transferase
MGIVTPIVFRLGRRWRVVDEPGPRKIHAEPLPLSGGWAIFITLSIILWGHLLVALAIRGSAVQSLLPEQALQFVSLAPKLIFKVLPIYAGAAAIFILGLIDDVKGMSVKSRLWVQFGLAGILAALGYHPNLGFLPGWAAGLIGVLWIVGITNSFNFLDGLDGLSTGVALVGTLALLTIMGITAQPDVVFFLAVLAGTQLGFLRFNYHPARLFLGSSGSLLLGYCLAISTLQVTYMKASGGNWLMPLLTPIFIVAIPLYDTISVVLIRVVHKRSIAIGDQSHFHHRLMKLGFSQRQTVAFIVLIAFSVGLSAVRLVHANIFNSCLILLQIMGMLSLIVIAERVATKVRNDIQKHRPISELRELTEAGVDEQRS